MLASQLCLWNINYFLLQRTHFCSVILNRCTILFLQLYGTFQADVFRQLYMFKFQQLVTLLLLFFPSCSDYVVYFTVSVVIAHDFLPVVQALILRNNGLKSLPPTLFKMCYQLSTLDLHGTEITNDFLRQVLLAYILIFFFLLQSFFFCGWNMMAWKRVKAERDVHVLFQSA